MQIVITLCSLLGFLCETTSYHYDKKKYLILSLWATLFYSVPYILTNAWSGLIVNIGSGVRDTFAYFNKPLWLCTAGMIIVNLFFLDSIWAFIPIVVIIIHGKALMYSEQTIRACVILEQALWFAYDLKYGLYAICLMNLFNIFSSLMALYKNRKNR